MDSPFGSNTPREIPPCPTCGGVMDRVYSRFGENVFVCVECHTGMTVPKKAWDIAQVKKKQKQDRPDEKTG